MNLAHDWVKGDRAWICKTCKACLIQEAAERFGMSWPPEPRDEVRLVDIEFKGPCWPKAPDSEQKLEYWKWTVAGQSYAGRKQLAELQREMGSYAPDPVP